MLSENDLYWIAGLLEGEGSFLKSPPSNPNGISIQLEMTDKDIVEKASLILEVPFFMPKRRKNYKQSYRLRVGNARAADWMKRLKPLMGQRRQQQIEDALKDYNPITYSFVIPSRDVLIEMHESLSLRQIAKQIGCSHQSILKHLKAA